MSACVWLEYMCKNVLAYISRLFACGRASVDVGLASDASVRVIFLFIFGCAYLGMTQSINHDECCRTPASIVLKAVIVKKQTQTGSGGVEGGGGAFPSDEAGGGAAERLRRRKV